MAATTTTWTGTNGADTNYWKNVENVEMSGLGGNDTLFGYTGNDTIHGGDGNDLLDGWSGDDYIWGDAGNDTMLGNVGNDKLWGDAGNDNLSGNSGNDQLYGGLGNDILDGGTENDLLVSHEGNDNLKGGDGNDTLIGATNVSYYGEVDTLTGGVGADTFVLGDASGAFYQGNTWGIIQDFAWEQGDKIQVFGTIDQYSLGSRYESGAGDSSVQDGLVMKGSDVIAVLVDRTDAILSLDFTFV